MHSKRGRAKEVVVPTVLGTDEGAAFRAGSTASESGTASGEFTPAGRIFPRSSNIQSLSILHTHTTCQSPPATIKQSARRHMAVNYR